LLTRALFVTLCVGLTLPAASAEQRAVNSQDDDSALRMLITRQVDGRDDIFIIGLDGGEPERLTNHRSKDSHAVPSRDGSRIVFNSERVGWWKIWAMDGDGENVRQLTTPRSGADYYPDWSPDGKRIVYVSDSAGNGDLFIMDADGSNATNLSDHPAKDNFPAWSPDGRRIAFASDRDGDWAIFVTDLRDKTTRRLSGEGNALEPAWYPDSRRIVYQSDVNGAFDLYSVSLDDSSKPAQLTRHDKNDKRASVSPDGRYIAFESDRDGGSHVYVVSPDGSGVKRLTTGGYNYGPRWYSMRAR
jgi:Tol biopolymer transport system component